MLHDRAGNLDEAHALLRRVIEIRERALGPDHPDLARALSMLGNVQGARSEFSAARLSFERSLEIRVKALGPEHDAVASSLESLGNVHMALNEYEAARARFAKALAIEEVTGPRDPHIAYPLTSLGSALIRLDRHAEAIPLLQRAVDVRRDGHVDPQLTAHSRFALARALWGAAPSQGGDRTRATKLADDVRALYTRDGSDDGLLELDEWVAERAR